jgi:hypothetical protein
MDTSDGTPDGTDSGNAGFGSGRFGSAGSGVGGSGSGRFGSDGFGSMAEALRAGDAVAGYLTSAAAAGLDGAACGEALITIARIQSRLAAAQAAFLARFDAAGAHDGDGYATSAAWPAEPSRAARTPGRPDPPRCRGGRGAP